MVISKSLAWWPFAATLASGTWLLGGDLDSHRQRQVTNAAEIAAEVADARLLSPRTLVVDYRDDVPESYLKANGLTEEAVSDASMSDRLYRIRFSTEAAMSGAWPRLKADPMVENVDFDVEATIPASEIYSATAPALAGCNGSKSGAARAGFPNDPCFAYQWHFKQIGLPKAWKLSQGKGVVVAVIDTGVSQVGDLAKTQFVPGYNFVDNNKDTSDDHGHGTHVAGTIAQSTNNGIGVSGVAFKASIMPLKVLSARGSGSMAAISQAIRWAADHGANVINMSLGGPFPVGSIHSAVKYARGEGVVVVAAAGNDGRGRVSYPGKYAEVISVAATQFDETTTFYSNWGKTVDIAAPGGNVRVDQNGDGQPDGVLQHSVVPGQTSKQDYLWFMGTSMAAPHVAGVAALVIAAGVTKPDAVEAILIETARPAKGSASMRADERINDHYGAGIVDAASAVARAKKTKGAGALAFAGTLAFGITSTLRRRKRLATVGKYRFLLGLCFGSSGFFVVPVLLAAFGLGTHAILVPLVEGIPTGLATWMSHVLGSTSYGNPLLVSAALPLVALALGLGIRKLRPALAGFAIGVAGLLLSLMFTGYIDVTWVPNTFDQAFLLANASLAACLGYLTLVRD